LSFVKIKNELIKNIHNVFLSFDRKGIFLVGQAASFFLIFAYS